MNDFNQLVSLVQNKLNAKERPALRPVLAFVHRELLRTRKVFYGGTAQNAYLPKKLQFYNLQKGLPDFDVYSTDALAFLQRLARKLHTHFHGFAEVRCALHPGTYKLAWNHRAILDVTSLPRSEIFRLQPKGSTNNLAPLSLIKANAYIELAMPDTAAFRWKKVFQRVQLLEKPTRKSKLRFKQSKGDILNELVERAYRNARQKRLPIAGVHAAWYYLQKQKPFDPSVTLSNSFARLQVLSTEPLRDAEHFAALARPNEVRVLSIRQSSYFSPRKVFVQVQIDGQWHNWISLHEVREKCIAVEQGFVSLFYLLYNEYLHVYRYGRSLVPWLLVALVRKVSVKRLRVECYGNAPSMTNLKQKQQQCKKKIG